MNDDQVNKVESLLTKSELDNRSQELMRQFFNSIAEQPQFSKIMDLLERFPGLFENFCKCFQIKKDFLQQGKTEAEWNKFISTEKDVFDKLDD
ncbi:hypothetical protein HN858_01145 [Candidatus Falkowbacteria bacterium]|jgi:hypothetical protein|nr:hypothetical protein [Candidatus Falkowbacteria bacterium]MBT6574316.1 hypothetical protein [Candidatus Falkowbacteria bacterium]MBT7348261.1 hypothetical protein [Candidatus Falkowbacteria bacterium]MBT7500240.1 hypothetical protein [Candidatus Falkowbacteria bacterium]